MRCVTRSPCRIYHRQTLQALVSIRTPKSLCSSTLPHRHLPHPFHPPPPPPTIATYTYRILRLSRTRFPVHIRHCGDCPKFLASRNRSIRNRCLRVDIISISIIITHDNTRITIILRMNRSRSACQHARKPITITITIIILTFRRGFNLRRFKIFFFRRPPRRRKVNRCLRMRPMQALPRPTHLWPPTITPTPTTPPTPILCTHTCH